MKIINKVIRVVLFLVITLIGTIGTASACVPPYLNCMEVGLDWEPITISPYYSSPTSMGVNSLTYLENGIVLATTMYSIQDDPNPPTIPVCGYFTDRWGTFPQQQCALLHRSDDYGLTWNVIRKLGYMQTWDMEYLGNGIVTSGRFRSTDYGLTWTEITTIPQYISFLTYVGNGILIATNPDGSNPSGYGGTNYLYRSTDYGLTYTGMTGPPQTNIPGAPGFVGIGAPYGKNPWSYPNGIVLIADFYGKVYRSTDYGLTWDTGTQVGNQLIWGFTINKDANVIYANTQGGWPSGHEIYLSYDGGISWSYQFSGGAMTFVPERFYPPLWQQGYFILFSGGKIYSMHDYGCCTWEEIANIPSYITPWAMVGTENGIVMAADSTSNRVWRSEPRMTEHPQPPTVTSMFNTVSGSSEVATVIEGTSVDFTVTSDQSVTWYWTIARPSGTVTTSNSEGTISEITELGTTTISVYGQNPSGNTNTITWTLVGSYNLLGILPPVKTDGSSIFKSGSTVPVKFRIADANGNYVSTAIAHLTYQYITSDILGTVEEAISTSAANEGNTFRYDSTDSLYIFNLGTSGMNTGTYQLNINLDDGTVHTVRISLR